MRILLLLLLLSPLSLFAQQDSVIMNILGVDTTIVANHRRLYWDESWPQNYTQTPTGWENIPLQQEIDALRKEIAELRKLIQEMKKP